MRDSSSAAFCELPAPSLVLLVAWATAVILLAISPLPLAASADVAADLVGRRRLLLDGAGDGVLKVIDLADDLADLADRFDRALGVGLDRLDLLADVLGGLGSFLGQLLDFVGHDGEALAGLAGPGGLDGGIQGQQIRLLGNGGDDLDDLADFGAGFAKLADGAVGCLRHLDGLGCHLGCLTGVFGDFLDRCRHFLNARSDHLDILADLFGSRRHHIGLGGGFLGIGTHLRADRRHSL